MEFASSTASSTHALPPELLAEIFLHLYKDASIPRADHDLHNTHKLTFVMLVCNAWRDIVERAPTLWTDIWLGRCPLYIGNKNTRQWLDYIKARFARSGSLPLNLTIMITYLDLVNFSQLLLQHISRCKILALRGAEDGTKWTPVFPSNTPSVIHRILSFPLPALQMIAIGEFVLHQASAECGPLELDAPNLRDITTRSPDIIPFVKPQLPHISTHNSLERLSASSGWEYLILHLPRDRLSLPNLKFLSVVYTDHLWNLLQVIDTPNIEHFVVKCGIADWPEEVDTVIPVMSNLRELEWYTDPNAEYEQPSLHHLLQHCPNLTSLSYICNEDSAESLQVHLRASNVDEPVLASFVLLHHMQAGIPLFCPELRRLHIACSSFKQVLDLVLLRPTLEYVSMQFRFPSEIIVQGSEDDWHATVEVVRHIRSHIQFEFPTNVSAASPDLLEEEGVFWDPSGKAAG
ncbi:hypothetical protein FRC01_010557 [Tulasnella sp. 417]|nr:hypothetical protein FRC01_010557 [Tulasnella sp. 417]